MTAEQWQTAISLIGIPGLILAAVGYAIWSWGWYFLINIAKPISVEVVGFIEHLKTQVEKLVGSTDRMCNQMERQGQKLDDHGKKLEDHGEAINEIKNILRK